MFNINISYEYKYIMFILFNINIRHVYKYKIKY